MIDLKSFWQWLCEMTRALLVAIDPGEDPVEVPAVLQLAPEPTA